MSLCYRKYDSHMILAWEYIHFCSNGGVSANRGVSAVDRLLGGGRINLIAWQICLRNHFIEHNIDYIINLNQSSSFYVLWFFYSLWELWLMLCAEEKKLQNIEEKIFFIKAFFNPVDVQCQRNSIQGHASEDH